MRRAAIHVGQMIQERLSILGIEEGHLKGWAHAQGLTYQQVWSNARGERISKDEFIVMLATRLGADPVYAILSAHADRAPEPYKGYFLAARQRYVEAPQMERGWAELEPSTRGRMIEIISDPDLARRVAKISESL